MSEIRVDTISEKTSANGVAIDGVTIKDGGISATTGSIVFNEASADVDFRVESNGNANAIFVNGGTDSVTIGASGVVQTIAGVPIYSADNSIYIGQDVSGTDSTAQFNTSIGFTTLDAITTGDSNVAIGYNAMTANNTGANNISIGKSALGTNTSGSDNIAIGLDALLNPDTESNNLGIGKSALGGSIAGGEFNVAIGNLTLDALTSGDENVAVGYQAGSAINSGAENVFVGHQSGLSLTTGANNIALGKQALKVTTTGPNNVCIGGGAGQLGDMTTGNNVLIGQVAGQDMANGAYNVVIGVEALKEAQGDRYNVAVGYQALTVANTGTSVNDVANTSVGAQSGLRVTSGGGNAFLGAGAGSQVTTGNNNVMIGQDVGTNLTTGGANIFIGQTINGVAAGRVRSIVIGTANSSSKGDNTTFISANGGTSFNGANTTAWDQSSDRRIKKNIVDNDTGLALINQIQIRDFTYRTLEEITDFDHAESAVVNKSGTQLGVIAQEVEEILPDLITETSQGVKTINTDNLTWYLINAVKELSAKVTALENA